MMVLKYMWLKFDGKNVCSSPAVLNLSCTEEMTFSIYVATVSCIEQKDFQNMWLKFAGKE